MRTSLERVFALFLGLEVAATACGGDGAGPSDQGSTGGAGDVGGSPSGASGGDGGAGGTAGTRMDGGEGGEPTGAGRGGDASGGTSGSISVTLNDGSTANTWTKSTYSLLAYKGLTVRIAFKVTTDSSLSTSFFLDDVSLNVCQ